MKNNSVFLDAILNFASAVLCINTVTNQVHPYKINNTIIDDPDYMLDGHDIIDFYKRGNKIHPNDLWQVELLADQKYMAYQCKNGILTSLIFRQLEEDGIVWVRVDFFIAADYSEENPYLFLVSHRLSEKEAYFFDSYSVLSEKFHKILYVDLKANTHHAIKEYASEQNSSSRKYMNGFPDINDFIKNGYVYKDDIAAFRRHLDPEYIKSYFSVGNTDMNFYYRRLVGGLFRWVKLCIIPAAAYSEDNPIFYYFIEDVHKTILKNLDLTAATKYAKFYGSLSSANADSYYENLLSVLHSFTQKYLDFYMLHLEKDLYIQYKPTSGILGDYIPPVGNYTEASENYIKTHCTGEQADILMQYSSSEKMRELMRNRLILEYEFTSADGSRVKTICQKTESIHGIPTKLLCRTVPVLPEKRLRVKTFGNFEVLDQDGVPIHFSRKQSKQLLAYLIDKQGYPVTSKDIVIDILEKPVTDLNAIKYVSTMLRRTINDLEAFGYSDIILKEQKNIRIDTNRIDCDYYHLLQGDLSYLLQYHNEYMKEYSWAEGTNAEIQSMFDK